MAYNKPGVYVEETLTPNIPVAPTVADSVAAFIGRADRGPTEVVGGNVVGIPTFINSWSDFVNNFSFGSSLNTFSGAGLGVTVSATSAAYVATTPNSVIIVATNTNLVVGMTASGTGIDPTATVTGISGANITLSRPITATVSGNINFANNSLKYAVKSFFDNGGGGAYVLREVNTDAVRASVSFRDSNGTITQGYSWSFEAISASKVVRIVSATAGQFTGALVGDSVSFSGVTLTNYTFLNSNRWVIAAVDGTGTTLDIVYNGATFAQASQALGTAIVITNAVVSATASLTVTAKDHGSWGNNVWVGIYPNNNAGYFDLHVYYSTTATVSSALTDANRVERFVKLSMDNTDARYVVNNVSSNWITVTDAGSLATGYADLPAFTGTWSISPTSVNINSVSGALNWNSTGFDTSVVSAARLGVNSTTDSALAGTVGASGTATPTATTVTLPRLDSLTFPLILNFPARTDATTVNALTTYAATRTDSFVVIDTTNDTVTNTLATIAGYTTNQNYGAVYYPNISIADPASSTGDTKTIPPGGAVAALYTITDTSRGVYKAPAGAQTRIVSAVSVQALTSDEFNRVGGTTPNLNVIRFVPGAGICIMGARTLKSNSSDIYVPVRRSLNYLSYNLRSITQFAVFEPNDANLWARINGVVTGFLDGFWREGGLAGASASAAYFVKCNETINTPAVINAGELRIEVGVALQRPAEFVIITIGQIDGGATVTTSI
jgi:phage tail sheath protein FI